MNKISLKIEGTFENKGSVSVDKKISKNTMGAILIALLTEEAKEEEERLYQREVKKQMKIRGKL